MTAREIRVLADAIRERYSEYDPGGAVRFGMEESVYAIAEMFQAWDVTFNRTAFLSRCFGDLPEMDSSEGFGYWPGEDADMRPRRRTLRRPRR